MLRNRLTRPSRVATFNRHRDRTYSTWDNVVNDSLASVAVVIVKQNLRYMIATLERHITLERLIEFVVARQIKLRRVPR